MRKDNITMDLGMELANLNKTVARQEIIIDELELKGAMYKAYFFGKSELVEKLRNQITENYNNRIGEFDGFCYASWRAKAVYRTLEDMYKEGIITEGEYLFCEL